MASRGQRLHETNAKDTSEMIHHHGVSLSKQQTADLLLCHGLHERKAKLDDA